MAFFLLFLFGLLLGVMVTVELTDARVEGEVARRMRLAETARALRDGER